MLSFKEFWTKKTLVALGLGQFLSLLITSTGFSSSELARRGAAPVFFFLKHLIFMSFACSELVSFFPPCVVIAVCLDDNGCLVKEILS
jgi:solute carrier family 35 protein F1/2